MASFSPQWLFFFFSFLLYSFISIVRRVLWKKSIKEEELHHLIPHFVWQTWIILVRVCLFSLISSPVVSSPGHFIFHPECHIWPQLSGASFSLFTYLCPVHILPTLGHDNLYRLLDLQACSHVSRMGGVFLVAIIPPDTPWRHKTPPHFLSQIQKPLRYRHPKSAVCDRGFTLPMSCLRSVLSWSLSSLFLSLSFPLPPPPRSISSPSFRSGFRLLLRSNVLPSSSYKARRIETVSWVLIYLTIRSTFSNPLHGPVFLGWVRHSVWTGGRSLVFFNMSTL